MIHADHSASMAAKSVRWSKRVGVQRYLRLLSRLSRMTPAEAAVRGIRIPLKKLAASRLQFASGVTTVDRRPLFAAAGMSVRDWLIRRFDERFLFGPAFKHTLQDPEVRGALAASPVVDLARALASDGLDMLGHRVRVAPGEMNWRADPRCFSAARAALPMKSGFDQSMKRSRPASRSE